MRLICSAKMASRWVEQYGFHVAATPLFGKPCKSPNAHNNSGN